MIDPRIELSDLISTHILVAAGIDDQVKLPTSDMPAW
jgi:hypothetical protein